MTVTISLINLKGGVGKTTLTVALAEFMALEHGLKVLVVDLDPQTNATVALMDEYEWKKKNVRGETVLQVFTDRLYERKIFSPAEAIVRNVSNIGGGIPGLDLLPSSIDLIEMQDEVGSIPGSGVFSYRPLTILGEAIAEEIGAYDIVLIDCPPNLGLITQNGLMISDYYLIPVIPDVLSTYGIPQIVNRVERLEKETGVHVDPLGLVIAKYRAQSSLHVNQIRILQAGASQNGYRRVFNNLIPESNQAAAVMDYTLEFSTLNKKYGYDNPYKSYQKLIEEVLEYVR